jgi:ribosome-binding factor A
MTSRHSRSAGGSGPGARAVRVAEQVHHELAELISRELKDPRVGMVTLTSVDITPDYAYATVHFTVLPSDEQTIADSTAGLRRAAGFLKAQLFKRIRIHTTPELRFVHDRSVERGMDLSKLIDEANAQRAADDEPKRTPD